MRISSKLLTAFIIPPQRNDAPLKVIGILRGEGDASITD